MFDSITKGFDFDLSEDEIQQLNAQGFAKEFVTHLNRFHSIPNLRDNSTDLYLHQCYVDVLKRDTKPDFMGIPYFSPSSSGSCNRELYVKCKGKGRDIQDVNPYQTRWQGIGTKIGDLLQEEILKAENCYHNYYSQKFPFRFLKNERLEPMFEDFAQAQKLISHNGQEFWLYGTTDGIMEATLADGSKVKIGLEIKSKQTSYSATGTFGMKSANEKHIQQTVAYSLMYDVDYWIVLYVNASKKGWSMDSTEQGKYPDIRAFGHFVTQQMKDKLLDKFAGVMEAVNTDTPPPLDLDNFTFNNYKTACATSLTDEEYMELIQQAMRIECSNLPDFKKRSAMSAIEFIDEVRNGK